MIRCSRCAHDNAMAQKFCGECGAPLHGSLPRTFPAAAGYTPPHLATGALTQRFALEGERKLITVMFCDIANSTPLAARVGADAMHGLLNRFFELALAEVHRYEGTVNQFLGDGFMALFGAPIAHEDHARRALLAAIAIQQQIRVATPDTDRLDQLQLRMGLNTGMVVVGRIGDNLRMDYTAIGDTTNLAARLQGHAEPGTIRTSQSTRRAADAYFTFDDLGRHALKGIAEPVAVFAPVAARAGGHGVHRSGDGVGSALVGRDQELHLLSRSLVELAGGRGGVVLLRGEPGLGKSRLIAEARRHDTAQRLSWLEGRSVSFGHGLSYWPFIEVLRGAFDIVESDSEADALRKIGHGAHAIIGAGADEIVPYVATVMSLGLPAELEPRVRFLDAQAMKRQVFLSMRLLFEGLARHRPTVVVLEDWHWVDQSSIALCEHLLPLAASHALAFWFTTRADPPEAAARVMASAHAVAGLRIENITLSLLGSMHSRDLIDNLVGLGSLPEAVRDQIQRRTGGNPFFIEEVIRAFIADGTLVEDKRVPGWRLARPMGELTIPDTVQGVIVARIDRLDEDAKTVLKLASVIGRRFFLRVLKAVSEAADAVEPGVARLAEIELVRLRQQVPEVEYIFKHALVQEAAYNSILAERRRSIHRSVALAIETLFAERCDEHASLLAYHYAHAQDWPKAHAHLLAAGDQAGRIAADAEALEHYRQAESAFIKLAAGELTPLQRATLDRKLGQAFYGIGNHDEAVAHFTRALAHLGIVYPGTQAGVRRALAKYIAAHFMRRAFGRWIAPSMATDAAQEASKICESLAWLDYYTDEARFSLDSLIALDVGERSGDLESYTRGLATLGLVLMILGLRRLAWQRIAESVAIAERVNIPMARAGTLFVRGWFEWTRGSIDAAQRSLEQSASAYQSIGDLRGWAGSLGTLVWVLARRCEFTKAASLSSEVVRVGEAANDPQLAAWGSVCLGHLGSIVGPLDEAAPYLEKVRSLSLRTSAMRMHANAGGVLAKSLLRRGLFTEARRVLVEAIATLEARGMRDMFFIEPITAFVELSVLEAARVSGAQRRTVLRTAKAACAKALECSATSAAGWQPETMRLHGTLAWLSGARSAALQRWQKSMEIAERMKLPVDLARTLLEMGDRTGNASHIEQARRIFEQTGAKVDLAFSLHALARTAAAAEGAHAEHTLRRYDEALAALDASKADHAAALARRERADLKSRLQNGGVNPSALDGVLDRHGLDASTRT
jgi:class 3 adenylate cyclase/tetratricopeptide (TPR) repeat protein